MAHRLIKLQFKLNRCSGKPMGVMALVNSQPLWHNRSWTLRMAGKAKTLRKYCKTIFNFLTEKRSQVLTLSPSSVCSAMRSCLLGNHQAVSRRGTLFNWLRQHPKVLKVVRSSTYLRTSKQVKKSIDLTPVVSKAHSSNRSNSRIKWFGRKLIRIKILSFLMQIKQPRRLCSKVEK
jgi:hypothetical protein